MLNKDYKDILQSLNEERVSYILVGAYALAAYGYVRATMDIDIWVEPSRENSRLVIKALSRFGAPLLDLTEEDLQSDDTVFQIGVAPRRIDIITGASGLYFEEAIKNAKRTTVDGIELNILSLEDLIKNKTATGRPKDIVDVEMLKTLI
jgi:predicted nucleotidyltransferase